MRHYAHDPAAQARAQSMVASASPNGLMPSMQRPWAKYFSKFITAYRKHGIKLWGVTVQNEAEAADVGWRPCTARAHVDHLWRRQPD